MARSGKFYSELGNRSSLELTKYYCINCCCSTVTIPIKLSSCVTWSTSEIVASVLLSVRELGRQEDVKLSIQEDTQSYQIDVTVVPYQMRNLGWVGNVDCRLWGYQLSSNALSIS